MTATDQTLAFLKNSKPEPVTVEALSMHLSKELGDYTSPRDAQGELESLRTLGFVMPCAPTAFSYTSNYPHFMLTPAGVAAAESSSLALFSDAANKLWEDSFKTG